MSTNPWDAAKKHVVVRGNHSYDPEPLDPGVNFFVLMLERLGCSPTWSCEGHPSGFYLVFQGPEPIARLIDGAGFFTVALCADGYDGYRISLCGNELSCANRKLEWTDEERMACLRSAARAWVKAFGPLKLPRVARSNRIDPAT